MVQPFFRTAAAQRSVLESLSRGVFAGSPNAYLLLSSDFAILDANEAYLGATMTRREMLAGRDMFDAFPDNPDDLEASGVRNLCRSFERALRKTERDVMPLQRYDVRRQDGAWELCYWRPANWSVRDETGQVIGLVHHVRRVRLASSRDDGEQSYDLHTGTAARIAAANRACEHAQERVGRSLAAMDRSNEQIVRSARRLRATTPLRPKKPR